MSAGFDFLRQNSRKVRSYLFISPLTVLTAASLPNALHVTMVTQVDDHKVEWKVASKIGSLDNAKHKPGGGEKKVECRLCCHA